MRGQGLFVGGWELGLSLFMVLLYLAGIAINPGFFGTTDAVSAVLRDAARYGVLAVGMTFVIVNKELDLSVGSTLGMTATVFSILFAPSYFDLGAGSAILVCIAVGLGVGLINGVLVTMLEVPAFIATLTMLFIGRGIVLGLTGGQTIAYGAKAKDFAVFFQLGETNGLGFNNQILAFFIVAALGAVALAATRFGWAVYATGGNEQAARYAGIPTRRIRMGSYVISSLAAVLAGLMNVAQDKGITSQYGQGAELIAIAAVIVGGASIAGGRGRVLGSCLGAALVVLIDKVLREGVPTMREIDVGGEKLQVAALAQLPPGAVPAFLGLILIIAVLIEPWLLRGRALQRFWAYLRRRALPPRLFEGVALVGPQTRGSAAPLDAGEAKGIAALLRRRDAAAILLMVGLWGVGMWLRPDYWGGLDNSFAMLLAFSEVALLAVGLTFVMAAGDIDLSVGSVLALSGATAAFLMKELGADPLTAAGAGFAAGVVAGLVNGGLVTGFGLPSFVASLGMFYVARGLAAWLVAGRQLSGFPETFILIGRDLHTVLGAAGLAPMAGAWLAITKAVSVQTIFALLVAALAALVLAMTSFGQMIYATGGNERAAGYAGIDTKRVRFISLVISAAAAAAAGIIYVAYYRSFNPSAGQLRELDAIAAAVIGGASIFGGYGTIAGSLAGAAVITLIRSLLSLQIILPDGTSFVMPQHWLNVYIGLILISAVVGDIWLRQHNVVGRWLAWSRKLVSG
ncbi:MAG: ABC transporter permease [Proteobacteria bacterium]|nr:ABC transporter permease [Pseudomonadota bacterium]MBI3500106.1 ABC transporter permease [Pseudomonadota bacterium]